MPAVFLPNSPNKYVYLLRKSQYHTISDCQFSGSLNYAPLIGHAYYNDTPTQYHAP